MGVGMAVASIASGVMQYGQGQMAADAAKNQAKFNAQQNAFNAQMMEIQKKETMQQAAEDVDDRYQKVSQMLGRQKVALAAGNISLGSELAAALEEDERTFAREDVDAIKSNARKQAMGIEVKQMDLAMQTEMQNRQADQQAQASITTGGIGFASSLVQGYGAYKKFG